MSAHGPEHVRADTRLCEACGDCVEACRGCGRCVSACTHGAMALIA